MVYWNKKISYLMVLKIILTDIFLIIRLFYRPPYEFRINTKQLASKISTLIIHKTWPSNN